MTYSISSMNTTSALERYLDHDVEKAIDRCVSGIIEQILWYLKDEGGLCRSRTMEIIRDCDHDEMAGIGLTLEQKVEAIEEGMELYEPGDLTFTFQMLRTELENYAIYFINLLAEGRAMEIFEGLHDEMDEHYLEPEQMREDNAFGWLAHRSEREEGAFTVYEYRNVEDPGQHIDVWEYPLLEGSSVFFEVGLDEA